MLVGLIICVAALQIPPALSSGAFVFTPYEVPGAYQVFDLGHINDLGQIVGDYQQNTGYFRRYGFVLNPGGSLAPIDIVGFGSAGLRYPQFVAQFATAGINNAGTAVGSYVVYTIDFSQPYGGAHAVAAHGFIRDAAGTLTALDIPGSTFTTATGINDAGQVVGTYSPDGPPHGFLRNPDGTVSRFDAPGAVNTVPTGVNNFGQIVGTYLTSNIGPTHGFLRDPDGTMTTVDVPAVRFAPVALNDLGEIAGNSSRTTALLREPDGTFVPIVAPAAPLAPTTNVSGINNLGQVAGRATYYPYDARYFIAARPVAQLPRIAPPPPPPPGTAPAIKRLKPDLCLHDPATFFEYGATVGLASAAASAMKRLSTPAKYAIYTSQLLALLGLGWDYLSCIQDPFDPNYMVRYEPRVPLLPSIPASTDIPMPLADSLTDATQHGSRAVAYLQAVNVSLNRYASALQVHDDASASLQEQAALDFVKLSSDELELFARELRKSAELAERTSLNQPVNTADVQTVFNSFRTSGAAALPAIEQGGFRMFGLDPSYLLTGGASRERPAPREAPERLSRPFSGALENIAHVMDRLGHTLREGRAHHD